MQKEPALCHVYGQYSHHDDVVIVANSSGLKALHKAIVSALNEGKDKAEVMVSDGEGYAVHIVRNDSPWGSDRWSNLAVPYTAEWAKESRSEAVQPEALLGSK